VYVAATGKRETVELTSGNVIPPVQSLQTARNVIRHDLQAERAQ
jgi:hypothetical protein